MLRSKAREPSCSCIDAVGVTRSPTKASSLARAVATSGVSSTLSPLTGDSRAPVRPLSELHTCPAALDQHRLTSLDPDGWASRPRRDTTVPECRSKRSRLSPRAGPARGASSLPVRDWPGPALIRVTYAEHPGWPEGGDPQHRPARDGRRQRFKLDAS